MFTTKLGYDSNLSHFREIECVAEMKKSIYIYTYIYVYVYYTRI